MKSNKLLIAFALCVAVQPGISFGSQAPQSQSFYQRWAPQRMQDFTGYVSKQTTSAYNTFNSWSTQKKIAVLTGLLLSLGVSAYVINRIITNDIPLVNNEFGGGNSKNPIISKLEQKNPIISKLEQDYAVIVKQYLENENEYNKAKLEFRSAKAAGTLTPELKKRVEHLVDIDNGLGAQLFELRKAMDENGVSVDQIQTIIAKARKSLFG